jgi:hypothetical protein
MCDAMCVVPVRILVTVWWGRDCVHCYCSPQALTTYHQFSPSIVGIFLYTECLLVTDSSLL